MSVVTHPSGTKIVGRGQLFATIPAPTCVAEGEAKHTNGIAAITLPAPRCEAAGELFDFIMGTGLSSSDRRFNFAALKRTAEAASAAGARHHYPAGRVEVEFRDTDLVTVNQGGSIPICVYLTNNYEFDCPTGVCEVHVYVEDDIDFEGALFYGDAFDADRPFFRGIDGRVEFHNEAPERADDVDPGLACFRWQGPQDPGNTGTYGGKFIDQVVVGEWLNPYRNNEGAIDPGDEGDAGGQLTLVRGRVQGALIGWFCNRNRGNQFNAYGTEFDGVYSTEVMLYLSPSTSKKIINCKFGLRVGCGRFPIYSNTGALDHHVDAQYCTVKGNLITRLCAYGFQGLHFGDVLCEGNQFYNYSGRSFVYYRNAVFSDNSCEGTGFVTPYNADVAGFKVDLQGNQFRHETIPAWQADTDYVIGDIVYNDDQGGGTFHLYRCVVAGNSASSGGPTGLGQGIVDGSVVWDALFPNWLTGYLPDIAAGNGVRMSVSGGSYESDYTNAAFGISGEGTEFEIVGTVFGGTAAYNAISCGGADANKVTVHGTIARGGFVTMLEFGTGVAVPAGTSCTLLVNDWQEAGANFRLNTPTSARMRGGGNRWAAVEGANFDPSSYQSFDFGVGVAPVANVEADSDVELDPTYGIFPIADPLAVGSIDRLLLYPGDKLFTGLVRTLLQDEVSFTTSATLVPLDNDPRPAGSAQQWFVAAGVWTEVSA